MAILIKADGHICEIQPKNKKWFTLEELQELVDGYIEYCDTLDPTMNMVINEEGKLNGSQYNKVATAFYRYSRVVMDGQAFIDPIMGDVVIGKREQMDAPHDAA